MKRFFQVATLVVMISAAVGAFSLAGYLGEIRAENGVVVDVRGNPLSPTDPRSSIAALSDDPVRRIADSAGSIDFDMTPCFFSQTAPLYKKWYGHWNVKFVGPSKIDGGAVLDECGNFGVTNHSPDNFLAFNCNSSMANGGVPTLPLKMVFNPPVSSVSFRIGSGGSAGQDVAIVAKAGKKTVDSAIVTLQTTMPIVNLSGSKPIKKVTITEWQGSNPCIVVLDDLVFTP